MTEIPHDVIATTAPTPPLAPAPDPSADAVTPLPEARNGARPRSVWHAPQDDVPFSAVARTNPDRIARALELARLAARIADDNRARDILLLDLRSATSLVDYFIIATTPSRRQSSGIAIEIDVEMKRRGESKLGIEGSEEGRWTLMDYGDFVVHLFSEEARVYYALEEIWGDALKVDWQGTDPPAVLTPPGGEEAPSPVPS